MKVLGIGGSPRKAGVTDRLLDKALAGAASRGASPYKITLNELSIKPCQDCGGCDKTGICVIDDDMRIVSRKLYEADGIIISSPIYFGSVSSQLKAMIDRCQAPWVAKYVLKNTRRKDTPRPGIYLCSAGEKKEEYFLNSRQIIRILFATLDINYAGELFYGGCNMGLGDGKSMKEACLKAFELGESLVGR